jgi:hypothetical protein
MQQDHQRDRGNQRQPDEHSEYGQHIHHADHSGSQPAPLASAASAVFAYFWGPAQVTHCYDRADGPGPPAELNPVGQALAAVKDSQPVRPRQTLYM